MQKVAVVLGEPDDLCMLAGSELRQGHQLSVLGLLPLGVDGPPVRAALRAAELLVHPLDHLVREGVAELVGVHVRLRRRVAHEVRQEALDQTVLAHDTLGALDAGIREDRLLLLAALDEPVRLEPLQHLPGRGARDTEHLRHPRGDRRGARRRAVLADREGEEVDRLQVLVDGMPRGHRRGLYPAFPDSKRRAEERR